ncbi:FMN-binding negative transcriptional regulator [Pseudomonas entomophila]|uniref:FMN-binding negative transcriptional regulator n=1 Tax=Pseudomonas entomophila TaxID=312306 RepID=UPI0015E47563|nr:FMN-binding negative transcriptional regulator [Pseudomonas entomophila]MBA1189167.1 FMN-binding negative transcriptional regulator [Pseudomonas entomophila]
MYTARPHQDHDFERLHSLMRQTRLAVLVTHGEQGLLATHLPVVVDVDDSEQGTVYGHLARANRQWQDLAAGGEALLVFAGANAYVSPTYYPSKAEDPRTVPTWNYLAVHAYGTAEVIQDVPSLLTIVTRLTDLHEGGRASPWQVSDAPEDYLAGMLRAIVGFRLPIHRLQGTRKLSQNRSQADSEGVRAGLAASPDPQDNHLAALMRQP